MGDFKKIAHAVWACKYHKAATGQVIRLGNSSFKGIAFIRFTMKGLCHNLKIIPGSRHPPYSQTHTSYGLSPSIKTSTQRRGCCKDYSYLLDFAKVNVSLSAWNRKLLCKITLALYLTFYIP